MKTKQETVSLSESIVPDSSLQVLQIIVTINKQCAFIPTEEDQQQQALREYEMLHAFLDSTAFGLMEQDGSGVLNYLSTDVDIFEVVLYELTMFIIENQIAFPVLVSSAFYAPTEDNVDVLRDGGNLSLQTKYQLIMWNPETKEVDTRQVVQMRNTDMEVRNNNTEEQE